jgi:hypothetical protein
VNYDKGFTDVTLQLQQEKKVKRSMQPANLGDISSGGALFASEEDMF